MWTCTFHNFNVTVADLGTYIQGEITVCSVVFLTSICITVEEGRFGLASAVLTHCGLMHM